MTVSFYADISEFQAVASNSYPYPLLAFRVDNGGRLDFHAAANWAHCRTSPHIQAAIGYVVFKPGQRANILRRVKALFGQSAPAKLVLMIDMESGSQFAGGGNHSTEANGLAADFATYLGSQQRVLGYANQYDFRSNWPTRPAWLKLVTAAYGTQRPASFGWQFYGGVPNPRPAGYPNSCAPFGSAVDLNAIQLPPAEIVKTLGLAPKPKGDDDVKKLLRYTGAGVKNKAAVYYSVNNLQQRWVQDAVDLAGLEALIKSEGGDTAVHETTYARKYWGAIVGPDPEAA